MSYKEDSPNILKNVTFKLKGGQKVGIVGRTGAGKSSIIQVLFATSPHNSGEYLIDGINIKDVSVRNLR